MKTHKSLVIAGTMCIGFIFINNNPKSNSFQLIVINNRDEHFNRATSELCLRNEHHLSGMDLKKGREGGGWLAVSTRGKLAMLLNLFTPNPFQKQPRGFLVPEFVNNDENLEDYAKRIAPDLNSFNPMSLLLLQKQMKQNGASKTFVNERVDENKREKHYPNNSYEQFQNKNVENSEQGKWRIFALSSETQEIHEINSEFISIGNSHIDTPFLKVEKSREVFISIINRLNHTQHYETLVCELVGLLRDTQHHWPDQHLQRMERKKDELKWVSSNLIELTSFGTISHSLILIDKEGEGSFIEISRIKDVEGFTRNNLDNGMNEETQEETIGESFRKLIKNMNSKSEKVVWKPKILKFKMQV